MASTDELRKLRKYHELTFEDMGKLLNITSRAYQNKEYGIRQFKMNEMFILSKIFNKTMDEIFLPNNFVNHEVEEGSSSPSRKK